MFGYKQCKKQKKSCQNVGFCHIVLAFPVKELPNQGHILLKPKKQHFYFN